MRICRISALLLVLFSLIPIRSVSAQAGFPPLNQELVELDRDWAYRWGDSPLDAAGVPVWTYEQESGQAWREINFPSNPPDR